MTPAQNQIDESLKAPEKEQGAPSLDRVIQLNRTNQIRQEIGIIADRSLRDHLINQEAYTGYRELAEGREQHQITADMLESTRKFAREHESKAIRIHQKIVAARIAKIASKNDEEFLMEKLVVDNIRFASGAEEVERVVDEKLKRMKDDKDAYEKLANHKLIKNVGYLKLPNTKIDLPSEEDFLKLTVPERRKLLKELNDALPEAEKHAAESAEADESKNVAAYQKKLAAALEKKIIGRKTAEKFMDGFNKIAHEEKERWLEEFDEQMVRYETLWSSIRSDLQGPALEYMESKRDSLGYTELLTQFGAIRKAEVARLSGTYNKELEKYREDGIIGRHTASKFTIWMTQQPLAQQYEALGKLPDEMKRYEKLWNDASKLKPKEEAFLRSKIDDWGYTELNQKLQAFKAGQTLPSTGGIAQSEKALAQVRSKEVQQAMRETDTLLERKGSDKRKAFMGVLSKMFDKENSNRFDATSFEQDIRAKTKREQNRKGRAADDTVVFSELGKDIHALKEEQDADVIKDEGFIQVKSQNEDGSTHRDSQVQINAGKSMDRFFSENSRQNFKSEFDGGNDDLSLSIWGGGGRIVELDLQEIRTLQDYLKMKEQERLDELDEAA